MHLNLKSLLIAEGDVKGRIFLWFRALLCTGLLCGCQQKPQQLQTQSSDRATPAPVDLPGRFQIVPGDYLLGFDTQTGRICRTTKYIPSGANRQFMTGIPLCEAITATASGEDRGAQSRFPSAPELVGILADPEFQKLPPDVQRKVLALAIDTHSSRYSDSDIIKILSSKEFQEADPKLQQQVRERLEIMAATPGPKGKTPH